MWELRCGGVVVWESCSVCESLHMVVAVCSNCGLWGFWCVSIGVGGSQFGGVVVWKWCSERELQCLCCGVWLLQFIGVTVCGSCSVWESRCVQVAMWGSCGVWQSWCEGVALWGSCSVWGSRWLPKLNSLRFWRFLTFPRFFHLRKKIDYLKNPHWPNRLPWLIFQGIWNRQGC